MSGRAVSRRARVTWTRLAFDDMNQERRYLKRHSQRAVREYARAVRAAVRSLREHPEMGRVHEDLSPLGRYRYVLVGKRKLIYRLVSDSELVIMRVWDARRDPDALTLDEP